MSESIDKLHKLEDEITAIRLRNKRVERDKAWENSWVRRISLAIISYIMAAVLLYISGVSNYLGEALVLTLGYLISTLSLSIIRKQWEARQS
jgi:hypothetical protein